ncbi:Peroxiredoxin, AhpC/Tsa family protein [Basidiobolus meristosporus CBS 931.73]|uniref:Peroxiredoxin, AhpC/Tsa family protein n=1 Tax=Basidiobolus meristosporus CBS 931.73 TaxID=1314790 RepID=A0A1Y1Y434_9FUNG|nr:Peroxiredoxin, AhpC/Tsa family protein [Basidiobolus meristosporus CBS 931.73]|eukprot:ORX92729.1 Peroxiredoxin, AhpC/Tsa family protein [Basidiobolus meristosporus CBS 931.73]
MVHLRLGDIAPNFVASTTQGEVDFHQWIGDSWAFMFSHPADFTPVCTTEIAAVAHLYPEFEKRNCKVIGISTDVVEDHDAWLDDIAQLHEVRVQFPIIADPDRKISLLYDMLDLLDPNSFNENIVNNQYNLRTIFVIDPQKKIRMSLTYPTSCGRNFNEVIRVIDVLQLRDRLVAQKLAAQQQSNKPHPQQTSTAQPPSTHDSSQQ